MIHRKLHDLVHGYLDGGVQTDLRKTDDGRLALYYTTRVKVLSVIFAALLAGVFFGVLFSAEALDWFTMIVFGLLVAVSFLVVAEVLTAKASFDVTDMKVSSLWQRKKRAEWTDLEMVRFNGFTQYVSLHFREGVKLYVYQYMSGMSAMKDFVYEVLNGDSDD